MEIKAKKCAECGDEFTPRLGDLVICFVCKATVCPKCREKHKKIIDVNGMIRKIHQVDVTLEKDDCIEPLTGAWITISAWNK